MTRSSTTFPAVLWLVATAVSGCVIATNDPTHMEEAWSDEAPAGTWSCYAPKPGHPTIGEKTARIELAAPHAMEAEATFGVPAAAILAMTANEGGYGWTRTALDANNAFGWKWTSSTAAGGRS